MRILNSAKKSIIAMRVSLLCLISVCIASFLSVAQNTTMRNLRVTDASRLEVAQIPDSTFSTDSLCAFDAHAVTLRGFIKRAGDLQESFRVTNNTRYRITGVKLLLRYTDANGKIINSRTVEAHCNIMPGDSQRISVRSFDNEKAYYYIYGSKPRLKSQPFDVAFRLLQYDIAIER